MERIRYIYEIKNKVNGKTYIGQHTLREGRTIKTDFYYGSGKLIKAAQKKYGLENFEKKVIIKGHFSKEQINRFERCMIACQRICGKAEYNLADGGDGGDTSKFIDYSKTLKTWKSTRKEHPEFFKNCSWKKHDGFTGKHHSDETKKRIGLINSERQKGSKNSQYGKKRSEEAKRKTREARKRRHDELFSKIREYINSLENFKPGTKIFIEIGKKFNVSYATIGRCYYEKNSK